MLQLRPGRACQEVFGHQPLNLLCGVGRRIDRVFAVLDLANRQCIFGQYYPGQPRHFLGYQRQSSTTFLQPAPEGSGIRRQRFEQKRTVQRYRDNLRAQVFQRAERHIGGRHFLQIRNTFLQILERVLELQCKKATQARAMSGGGQIGLVEHLDQHRIPGIDQRREAHQHLGAFADLEQLGQFTKRPCRVAFTRRSGAGLAGTRRSRCSAWSNRRAAGLPIRHWRRPCDLEPRKRLKCTTRLRAELGLERAQTAPGSHLAAVFVHHTKVHEQMRAQGVELEVGAFDIQRGDIPHHLQQGIREAAVAKRLRGAKLQGDAGGTLGQRHEA